MTTLQTQAPWLEEIKTQPPRSWTSGLLLLRAVIFMVGMGLLIKTLGIAPTLAVALVFWALFWPD